MAGLLEGVRVLEVGHFVAAPFCTRLLADLGADVIKVEPLSGDPVRQWGEQIDGKSLWWSMHGRNKRSIALDLKHPEGREIVRGLASKCDALVENFRPGQLARLGLGAEVLRDENPGLILAHISGYGQSGPGRDRAAFGVIGEAIGGLRYLTNHPPGTANLPPVRVGVSIGDSVAGLYTAFGIMSALWSRDAGSAGGQGRTIDVALTDSVLSLMEGMLPEYGALGRIKEPTGGGIATAAPTNAYPTRDGDWVLIAANSEPLFQKLTTLLGRSELAGMEAYRGNRNRVANARQLDIIIGEWTRNLDLHDLLALLEAADIPHCKAFTAADCAADPQYRERQMVREVYDPQFATNVLQAGVVPHVPDDPGEVRWAGPAIGEHGDAVMTEMLGYDMACIARLRSEGVVA